MQTSHTCSRDIQCFKCLGRGHIASQCLNKRTMILKGKYEYKNQYDESSEKGEKEKSEGELLMIRRTLNNQPSVKHETQRENIFHTRCKILENTCSLNVDSGSC